MRYQVRDPEGTLHEIEGPEGASPDEIIAAAQRVIPTKAAEPVSSAAEGATLKFGPLDTGVSLPPWATEGLAGAGRRMLDIATFGNRSLRDDTADAALDKSISATVGSAATDLATLVGGGAALRAAGTIPRFAGAAPKVASAVKTIGQNMLAPTSVRNAAATAGLYGAATQEGDLSTRAMAGATQGAFGAAGQALPNIMGAIIKPNVADDVSRLAARNIRMTPGQIMGGRVDLAEQKVMSLPLVGDAIAKARGRSLEDFNRAVADDVLSSLGKKAEKLPGRDLVVETQRVVSQAYDDVLPRISATFDTTLNDAIDAAKSLAAESGKTKELDAILQNRLFSKFNGTTLTGESFKEADSLLAETARKYRMSADGLARDFADSVETVRKGLRASAQGSADDLAKLKATDLAYAKLVRMENAAASRGAKDGVFTPAQFGRAVEKGAGRKTKAAGTELMGGFADDAERRLSTNFPNSGTVDRLLLSGGILGAGYAAGVDPQHLALAGIGMGAYSRPGQAMIRAAMTKRPNSMMLEDVAMGARAAAPIGGLLAPYLLPVYTGQK